MLTRLRIAGFKSFAEPVTLDILPGLTGIVGPNGCGKSNVVEALRWAMGETSARSLRGGEMDDVIFAGTTARASRNLAEVTVTLEGALPPPFEAKAELQVTRRIERGAGSQFRIQGREHRARDVQTLFADMASGARSSGMVSQGRVSALVNAKPEERRQVLEEAAGITGLHARRHEAELKLRAAETNLLRAEDLRTQQESALDAMRRQARQASRYIKISGLIRGAEAEHLGVLLARAETALACAEADYEHAVATAGGLAAAVMAARQAVTNQEADLPQVRAALSAAERLLERRRVEAESLEAERLRARQRAAQAEQRLRDAEADFEQAGRVCDDARASTIRLRREGDDMAARLAALPQEIARAQYETEACALAEGEARLTVDTAGRAVEAARLARAQSDATTRATSEGQAMAEARYRTIMADLAHARSALLALDGLEIAKQHLAACVLELDLARAAESDARDWLQEAARILNAVRAESDGALKIRRQAEHKGSELRIRHARLTEARRLAAIGLEDLRRARPEAQALAIAREMAAAAAAAADASERRVEDCEHAASQALRDQAVAARLAGDVQDRAARALSAIAVAQRRLDQMEADLLRCEQALANAERDAPPPQTVRDAEAVCGAADRHLASAGTSLAAAAVAGRDAESTLSETRRLAACAQAEAAQHTAEAAGLADAIGPLTSVTSLLGTLDVPPGLENALGAALFGLDTTSLTQDADRFWRELPLVDGPCCPPGKTLASLVKAPAELARLLAYAVLVEDGPDGQVVQAQLTPGMIAVRADGASWRWDGLVTRASAENPASIRLVQQRRLAVLRAAAASAAAVSATWEEREAAAVAARRAAAAAEDAARAALVQAELQSRAARSVLDASKAARTRLDAIRTPLAAELDRLHTEAAAERAVLEAALSANQAIPDQAGAEAESRRAGETAAHAQAGLEAARHSRQASRGDTSDAQAMLQRLELSEAETGARIAAAIPALQDLDCRTAEEAAQLASTEAAIAALPNPDRLATRLEAVLMAEAAARTAEIAARDAQTEAEQRLEYARKTEAAVRAARAEAESHVAAIAGLAVRTREDLDAAADRLAAARREAAGLPDLSALETTARVARATYEDARVLTQAREVGRATAQTALGETQSSFNQTAADLAAWTSRHDEAFARAATLQDRCTAARADWQACQAAPCDLDAKAAAAAQLSEADHLHQAAVGVATAAEALARAHAGVLGDAEQRHAASREVLARAEGLRDAARGAESGVLTRIAERLGEDSDLPQPGEITGAAEERARRKFERLTREREEMGPVNLRAELELAELEERAAVLDRDRGELATAIAKLRGAIGHINREGRERLSAVFTLVDQHFQILFTRMMGGGRAHLALTGSDDPLQAGLEIYAEPPGKKLSSLALLSGGEQALTALSLIFAVFRCTPAPISVLDEVDAPLDDANVERFCTLLDDVVRETGTRFLVVTHHQLTMSRMDRLFGVTMQERGISRLLSVDLRQAAQMVTPLLHAAE